MICGKEEGNLHKKTRRDEYCIESSDSKQRNVEVKKNKENKRGDSAGSNNLYLRRRKIWIKKRNGKKKEMMN